MIGEAPVLEAGKAAVRGVDGLLCGDEPAATGISPLMRLRATLRGHADHDLATSLTVDEVAHGGGAVSEV